MPMLVFCCACGWTCVKIRPFRNLGQVTVRNQKFPSPVDALHRSFRPLGQLQQYSLTYLSLIPPTRADSIHHGEYKVRMQRWYADDIASGSLFAAGCPCILTLRTITWMNTVVDTVDDLTTRSERELIHPTGV